MLVRASTQIARGILGEVNPEIRRKLEADCIRLFFHVCTGNGGDARAGAGAGGEPRVDVAVVLRLLRVMGFHVEGAEAAAAGGGAGGAGDRLKGFTAFIAW